MVLYYNRFLILFAQLIHKKQTQTVKKPFLMLQYSTLKSTVVQQLVYRDWHQVNRQEEFGRREKGEEVGDGRAEGSLVGDGGQPAISLMP